MLKERAQHKKQYASNPDKFKEKSKRYIERDPARAVRLRKLRYVRRRKEHIANAAARRTATKLKAVEMLGGKCVDCGLIYPIVCYDFHHLDPSEKEHEVGSLLRKAWCRVEEEIKKCVLLCSNCHRIRHFNEK